MIFERKRSGNDWENVIAPQFLKEEGGQFLKYLIDGTPTKGTFLSEYIERNGKGIKCHYTYRRGLLRCSFRQQWAVQSLRSVGRVTGTDSRAFFIYRYYKFLI